MGANHARFPNRDRFSALLSLPGFSRVKSLSQNVRQWNESGLAMTPIVGSRASLSIVLICVRERMRIFNFEISGAKYDKKDHARTSKAGRINCAGESNDVRLGILQLDQRNSGRNHPWPYGNKVRLLALFCFAT
jgi:hypothetical protein